MEFTMQMETAAAGPRTHLAPTTTPHERGREKKSLVLEWIYRWHKTAAPLIQELLGTSQRDYLLRLAKQGLVKSVDAPSMPIGKIWMLTKDGIAEALDATGEALPYDLSPTSIDYADLRHDLAAQRAVLSYRKFGKLTKVIPERLLGADLPGKKRPDAIATYADDDGTPHTYAFEIELTPKKERELDQAILSAARQLKHKEVDLVIYFARSLALLANYKQAVNSPLNLWKKNPTTRKWEVTDTRSLPEAIMASFEWEHAPDILKGFMP